MSLRISKGFKAFALASAFIGMVACGSSNNNNGGNGDLDPGTGTGNPSTDTQTTSTQVQTTTQTGVQQVVASASALKFVAVDSSVACAGGGTAQVTGDVDTNGTTSTYDLEFDFTGCNALDGTVNVTGDIDITGTSYSYAYTITGDVGGNGCIVDFEGYLIDISIPDFTNPISYTLLIDGSITGECNGGNTTCDYDNVTIENGVLSGAPICN